MGDGYIQLAAPEANCLRRKGLPVVELMSDERMVLLGTKFNAQGARVCAALTGKLGKRVACDVYAERPALCRQFEAGSPECLQARRALGLG
jgi:uncharacterized protein